MKRFLEFLTNNAVSLGLLISASVAFGGGIDWMWQQFLPRPAISNAAPVPSPQQITTIVNAIPDSQLRLIAESRTAENAARSQAAELAERLSVSRSALQTFFQIMGESQVQEHDVRSKLVEIATGYLSLREEVSHLGALSEETANFFSETVTLVASGKLREADVSLLHAEGVAYYAVRSFNQKTGDAYRAATITVAEIRATRGNLALTRLNYEAAVGRYNEAIEAVNGEGVIRGRLELQLADAYYRLWNTTKKTDALQHSADTYSGAFRILNKCLCDIRDFAHHTYQFGIALMQLPAHPDDQSKLVEAADLFQSALDQREARLPAADIIRAMMLEADAYARDLESDREPGFTISNLNHATSAVQAARNAELSADLVPDDERYQAKLMLARTYAQLAKQASLGLDAGYARKILSLTDEAMEQASRLQHLSPSEAVRLELARSESAEAKATLDRNPDGLETARLRFVRIAELAGDAQDHALEALARDNERRLRGKIFDLKKSLSK